MEFFTLKEVSKLPKDKQEIILGFIPENKKELDGALSDLLTCDPDYLKLGTGKVAFVEKKGIVVTVNELPERGKTALTIFFSNDKNDIITEIDNTWDSFNYAINAIAYRGGRGYGYSIWKLNGFSFNEKYFY